MILAEDHLIVAEQLRALLATEFDVVAVVGDGAALVAAVVTHRPEAIVTDIAMPGVDGIAATRLIRQRDSDARIVLVSVHRDAVLVAQGLAAGATGFVSKVAAGEELTLAVWAALRRERPVSPWIADPTGRVGEPK